jgi:hypothetical protein
VEHGERGMPWCGAQGDEVESCSEEPAARVQGAVAFTPMRDESLTGMRGGRTLIMWRLERASRFRPSRSRRGGRSVGSGVSARLKAEGK